MNRRLCFVSLFVFFLVPSFAQEMPAPVDIQYQLLIKILTFDRNLHSRVGDTLVIGILYQKQFRTSLNVKDELLEYYTESKIKGIDSIHLSCVPINFHSVTDLENHLDMRKVDLVYIAPLRGKEVAGVATACQVRKILTATGVPEYMDHGVVIAIDLQAENPQILINLDAAKKIGVEFNSQLLKLSKIVR